MPSGTPTRDDLVGFYIRRRRRHYTVAFERADLFTNLPAPRYVDLIGPGA